MTKKLTKMPHAQACVRIFDDGTTQLISYTTCAAEFGIDGWLTIHGLYSATTRKHLSAFGVEYCNIPYSVIRHCCDNRLQYNIYTGEVRSKS